MSEPHHAYRHILITGASSGIGEALALAYAAPGVTLSLSGRSTERLAAICDACKFRGADVAGQVVDVIDAVAMESWMKDRDSVKPLDLVIANAGVSSGTAGTGGGKDADSARTVFNVNVSGVLNTVFPAVTAMRARGGGQIAIMSSLAGFHGMGSAIAYGASKAAVRVWGEGLRIKLSPENIWVSVICPGFVRSRITDANRFHMPFFMEADRAAAIIKKGLAAKRGRIAFPWPARAAIWAFMAMPDCWAAWIAARLPSKV